MTRIALSVAAWLVLLLLVSTAYWGVAPPAVDPVRDALLAEREAATDYWRHLVAEAEAITDRRIKLFVDRASDEAERRERAAFAKANRRRFSDEHVDSFVMLAELAYDEAERKLARYPPLAPKSFGRALAVTATVQTAVSLLVLVLVAGLGRLARMR